MTSCAKTEKAPTKTLTRLVFCSLLLTIVVIGLGAYTRLTHAGLGCPDWPTCYGLLDVPRTAEEIITAEQAYPERPVEPHKAWNEMVHRYFAGSLGILIAIIAFYSIRLRVNDRKSVKNTTIQPSYNSKKPLVLPLCILLVVIFQAALGMWTVTLKLMPVIVMGHLLGGFTTLCLLFLLYLRLNSVTSNTITTIGEQNVKASASKATSASQNVNTPSIKKYSRYALLGIVILTAQIALGGWTSANYAAMSCVELPICQGDWLAELDYQHSFTLIPPVKSSYEFGHFKHNERVTIHVTHRLGAIVTSIFITWLAILVFIKTNKPNLKRLAIVLLSMLTIQVSLGISNIWFSLPLSVAVAHNLVAALLMLSLIALTYQLKQHDEEVRYE
ncbi:COX15/CtaA family protein [Colwellia sp. E2M01]|uniref:COX15/CtaA family protein n=1 Tax=Colwellia sp. E2M01 TaxID=2841561 RepID=UPI001C08C2A3|nr:COX15/CtaA family protein [Colwellia sp. E2M01]MBU2869527.1 COX15/CtaA family protein [Colwellia sp. E2M01]